MLRSKGLRALALGIMMALSASVSTGCGAHGGIRYAKDVDDLKENVRHTFRIDVVGTHDDDEANWLGTGVVIHESGYLLTNKHVVDGAKDMSIAILEQGKTVYYPAKTVAVSKDHDLAVVKIERKFDSSVELADNDDAAMLANVYTAGFPRNINMTGARGEIARVGVTEDTTTDVKDDMLVYIEGGPGSSGSGVFLTDGGELVGLVKMVRISRNSADALLGSVVAEPISHIRSFLKESKIPHHD